jgi:hypothetical protein
MKYIKNYKDLNESEMWERFNEEEPSDNRKYYVVMHQATDTDTAYGKHYIGGYCIRYFINAGVA